MKLNKEEEELLEKYNKKNSQSVSNLRKEITRYQDYARNTSQKNKRINIRISEQDLLRLQRKAIEEGLPYQTLISSVLHKFVSGGNYGHVA